MNINLERLQVSAPVRLYREFVTFHPLQINPLQGEQWRPRQRVPEDARRWTHSMFGPLHRGTRNGPHGGCSRSLRVEAGLATLVVVGIQKYLQLAEELIKFLTPLGVLRVVCLR